MIDVDKGLTDVESRTISSLDIVTVYNHQYAGRGLNLQTKITYRVTLNWPSKTDNNKDNIQSDIKLAFKD